MTNRNRKKPGRRIVGAIRLATLTAMLATAVLATACTQVKETATEASAKIDQWLGTSSGEAAVTAAAWVRPTSRLCYAAANEAGKPTSSPVLLHVRKAASTERAATD